MLKKILGRSILPMFSGAIIAFNLAKLVGTNPNYDAQWWKVGAALIMGLSWHFIIGDREL